jgi:fructosamine-3-kinase
MSKSVVPYRKPHASVIVDDLHVERVSILPLETQTPLLVDPNAVLPLAIPLHGFEKIRRWGQQVAQIGRTVQIFQLGARPLLNLSTPLTNLPWKISWASLFLNERIMKSPRTLKRYVINVKR